MSPRFSSPAFPIIWDSGCHRNSLGFPSSSLSCPLRPQRSSPHFPFIYYVSLLCDLDATFTNQSPHIFNSDLILLFLRDSIHSIIISFTSILLSCHFIVALASTPFTNVLPLVCLFPLELHRHLSITQHSMPLFERT